MIVETMTDLELLKEILKDLDGIGHFYASIQHNAVYKNRLKWGRPKEGQFVIRINDWKSPNGNLYTFIIKTSGWNEFKKGEFKAYTLTFFKRKNALNAIRIVNKNDDFGIEIFTSHFIDRYNQRFLKKPFLSHKEVVLQYIDRNAHAVISNLKSPKYDFNVMVGTEDGYSFGKYDENEILVNKTFVSRDMLFGGQFETGDFLDEAVINSKNGAQSNIFRFNEELKNILSSERPIPTMDDLIMGMEILEQCKEKEAALEQEGKETDMQLMELQNQLFLWAFKFDWLKGKLQDEDGNIVDDPILKQLSVILQSKSAPIGSYI